ncbi:MAG: hypothetical protein GY751_16145, partial [Bacteroidetes bacterium]|nr:hypothetical protein [Bacteroidota bacterium]
MKKELVNAVFFVLILMWVPTGLNGQSMVASVGVSKVNIDLRGSVQILDSLTLNVAEAGKAVLRFDGYCIASPGDKIYLAVSSTKVWGACDDNINLEVPDNDVNMSPFTHTRVFDLVPGTHTFYAVAHNYIELNGTGIASVHGNLLAQFFGDSDPEIIGYREIVSENKNVRTNPHMFAATTLDFPDPGKVHVAFDGLCISTVGDLITLAATDEADWLSFNGGVLAEAYSNNVNGNSFSHSKVYDVSAGTYTFYAGAENIQELDGNGRISVFGSLTAIYYPDKIKTDILESEVILTSIDVRNEDYVLDEIEINSTNGGIAIAQFNGMANIQP